jgi:enoyl-CoA hydratase
LKVYEQAGITVTQQLATIFDGITRHTPEGVAFKDRMVEVGLRQAVRERDQREDGDNVIRLAKL